MIMWGVFRSESYSDIYCDHFRGLRACFFNINVTIICKPWYSKIFNGRGGRELSQVDNTGIFYIKAGFDGASSQSIYNQQYKETDLGSAISSEESLLQTSIVPLKLVVGENEVWVNQRSSSSHYCQLLRLQYNKETKEISQRGRDSP